MSGLSCRSRPRRYPMFMAAVTSESGIVPAIAPFHRSIATVRSRSAKCAASRSNSVEVSYSGDGGFQLPGDEQAAFAVAAWLQRADRNGSLGSYFNPPLTKEEREVAAVEGWILGVV